MKLLAAKKIVICEQPDNKTASGVLLAEDEGGAKRPETGIVRVIGEGKTPVPMKVGSIIVFRKYTDNRTAIEGKQYNFVSFKDIVAVVRD